MVPQRGGGLDQRLAAAFEDVGDAAFLVGMDTPQLTPELVRAGLDALEDRPAVLGPAPDGGYWSIGLRDPDRAVFDGVPMSSADTCAAQRDRLTRCGLTWTELPPLRDVDNIEDARAAVLVAPSGRFARALADLDEDLAA